MVAAVMGIERVNMSKFLLTVFAFGLLLSPAFAEDKTPEQLREERSLSSASKGYRTKPFTVSSLLEQSSKSASTLHSTPIALPLVMSTSVSPNNPNMARWKL